MEIKDLKFDERGLIPAIVQDAKTGRVLTLAYMNKESLRLSMQQGLTCFWSRYGGLRRRLAACQGRSGRTRLPPRNDLLLREHASRERRAS